jgi:flagellar motor switch/type III secretory pathway protein FliN
MANTVSGAPAPVVLTPGTKLPETPDPLARAYDLPCTLVLEMATTEFNVRSLLHLRPGSIVRTATQQNEDVLLKVNGQLVGTVELDVVGNRLAVRVTGIA